MRTVRATVEGVSNALQWACPRCATPLTETSCSACGAVHPRLGRVPVVLHDAAAAHARFAARVREFQLDAEQRREQIARALADAELLDATRTRLHAFTRALDVTTATITELVTAAGVLAPAPADREHPPSPAGHAPLLDYYEYVFRDWAWGDDENDAHAALVLQGLDGGPPPRRVLVLGAGAGRLAFDLHRHSAAELTLAIDVNPLPLLVADRLVGGAAELVLWEFAANHVAGAQAVAERRLRAPIATRPGFVLALADATRPPIVPGSFDVVVTPWFLDHLGRDIAGVLPAIHGTLARGGRWVFFGPLLHARGTPLAACYTSDELLALAEGAGFEIGAVRCEVVPYLRTPEGTGRSEPCLVFAADAREEPMRGLPMWIRGIERPIPRVRSRASRSPVQAAFASLVDGTRSIATIAGMLAGRRALTPRIALDATIDALLPLFRVGDIPDG